MCTPAPDMTQANAAAARNADVGQQSLDFYKQVYNDGAPDRATASALALKQAALQNDLSQQSVTAAQQDRQRYQDTFQPIEQQIASDAQGYDTPARREAAAQAAGADVQNQASLQRDASGRSMARLGVSPNSGRSMALNGSYDLGTAKLRAGAANTARRQVETLGSAKLADAAALGRGVISNQATQAAIGLNSGNSAVGNASTPSAITQQGAQLMGQGFNTAIAGNNSAANIYGNDARIQSGVDASNGQQTQAGVATVATIAIAI